MTKWLYKIKYVGPFQTRDVEFDSFGKEGWELVSVSNDVAYFKKPVPTVRADTGPR